MLQAIPQPNLLRIKTSKLIRAEGTAQASTGVSEEGALEWAKKDNRRLLHVVYRVGDLDKTINFYTECLGMKLLRKRDIPEEKYSNAFLGYGPEDSHFAVELTYNYGVNKYDIGTGFGHFGIAVEDVSKTVELIKAKGGKVTREPGPVKGGKTVIAFIEDPDGYKFEILERGPTPEPLCQVMLRVGDLDRSINFYEKAFGMELLRKRDNPQYKYTIAMMGYGPEDKNAVLELTYNYGVKEYDKGNAYAQIAIGTDDVYRTAEAVKLFGGKITREPGPLPGINTKITACLDPDGWKTIDRNEKEDPRLMVMKREWFDGKDCLDIGCNQGLITIEIAKKFFCRSILGIDIDGVRHLMIMEPESLRVNHETSIPSPKYAFFDLSGSILTSFHPKLGAPLESSHNLKVLVPSMDAIDGARSVRIQSLAPEPDALELSRDSEVEGSTITSDSSRKDLGAVSSAGTCDLWDSDGADASEDERSVDDVFCEGSVKKKMEVLAGMVGYEGCDEPGVILDEVVKVLKELERMRTTCCLKN
ncbi:putative lactoylglutathione lyase, chloroplastic [Cocos nucifera]|nr:putative lactoylglutathione lyase, chloroplastic [Cocos nucifera]